MAKTKPSQPSDNVQLLSKERVLALCGDIGATTLFEWIRDLGFPAAIEMGPPGKRTSRVAWFEHEVIAWIKTRPRRQQKQHGLIPRRTKTKVAASLLVLVFALAAPPRTLAQPFIRSISNAGQWCGMGSFSAQNVLDSLGCRGRGLPHPIFGIHSRPIGRTITIDPSAGVNMGATLSAQSTSDIQ